MAEKRYYWLKLQDDFFNSLRIKKLRKLAGGDTFTIIYLKMQLLAMKKDGVLEYKGLEDSFAKELALELDEDDDNVDITVRYLLSCGLLETSNERRYFVPYAVENTGSEGSSAKRMRDARAKTVTLCEQSATLCEHRYGDKEIEIEKELEIEKESKKGRASRFTPPSVDEVDAYCRERNNGIDAQHFVDYYARQKWKLSNGNKMADWHAAVRTWESRDKAKKSERGVTDGKHERIGEHLI